MLRVSSRLGDSLEELVHRVIGCCLEVDHLAPVHQAQVISYLQASGLQVGLLVNFNVPTLPQGLRRIVL